MEKLLTKKELAERCQVTETSIDNWGRDGILTVCKGIPVVRFSLQHIMHLEGVKIENNNSYTSSLPCWKSWGVTKFLLRFYLYNAVLSMDSDIVRYGSPPS